MSHQVTDQDVEKWENGEFGQDMEHTKISSKEHDAEIDDALGLKSISLRLQASLIEDLKVLAKLNGIGYQPLARQVLTKFVTDEMHKLAIAQATDLAARR